MAWPLHRCFLTLIALLLWADPIAAQALPGGVELLTRYHQALQALEVPQQRRYEQRIQTAGWQEAITTGQFYFRPDGSFQANLTEADHFYRLDSDRFRLVSEADRLALYTEYSERPERVAPHATLDLDATAETYRPTVPELTEIRGKAAYHLRLTPLAGGRLRELWLDPQTALPRRAVLALAGVWGIATATLDFQPVGSYWLPERTRMQIDMNFWVPVGFERRAFTGRIDIGSLLSNYRIGEDTGPPLPILPETRPVRARAEVVGEAAIKGTALGAPIELSVTNEKARSPIADKIAQFNLNKPDLSNPLTRINVFCTLKLGKQDLLLYLFRFDSKQPLMPVESVNAQQDTIRLFGTK